MTRLTDLPSAIWALRGGHPATADGRPRPIAGNILVPTQYLVAG